jgi:hypothetical protein
MPTIYRVMTNEARRPKIGPTARTLGVRPTAPPEGDITVIEEHVAPMTGGMSVAPNWRMLPTHRLPPRMIEKGAQEATGKNTDACWKMHEGDFASGPLNDELVLDADAADHGTVQPRAKVLLTNYQNSLGATVELWSIDED